MASGVKRGRATGAWQGVAAEFQFIEWVRSVAGDQGAVLGIGDDAAVWRPGPDADQVATSDLLLEGVHFDPATTPLADLGAKALAVNLSDLAAMGAVPRWALLSLGLPGDPDRYRPLVEEFVKEAREAGVTVVGGDTCATRGGLVIAVTAVGEVPAGRAVTRAGARPGDGVWVTGTPGESAAGLALLGAQAKGLEADAGRRLVGRHLRPTARTAEGVALREAGVSAMIDVSDGLAGDVGHVLAASAVGALLDEEALPISDDLRAYCRATQADPVSLVLEGGEDYELVFTVPAAAEARVARLTEAGGVAACRIGAIEAAPGLRVRAGGRVRAIAPRGYEHFT